MTNSGSVPPKSHFDDGQPLSAGVVQLPSMLGQGLAPQHGLQFSKGGDCGALVFTDSDVVGGMPFRA